MGFFFAPGSVDEEVDEDQFEGVLSYPSFPELRDVLFEAPRGDESDSDSDDEDAGTSVHAGAFPAAGAGGTGAGSASDGHADYGGYNKGWDHWDRHDPDPGSKLPQSRGTAGVEGRFKLGLTAGPEDETLADPLACFRQFFDDNIFSKCHVGERQGPDGR